MPTNRLLAAITALLISTGVARATTPPLFTYSGFLQDSSGNVVTGVHDFTFRFYNAPTAGAQIGTDVVIGSVPVAADGYFSVVVDVTGFSSSFSAQTYMAVKLDLESFMSPRIQLTSVPGALSVPFGGVTGWPTSQCPASQFVVGYDVNGNLVCGAEGGVSGVSAGAGITVTGSGAVTVAANLATSGGDNGSASTIARSDHVHDARYPTAASLQASGTLNAPGNPVDWTKLKGVPAAFADGTDDGITTLMGTGPITTSVSGAVASVGLQACATNEVLEYNGAAWTCTASPFAGTGGGLANNGPQFTLNATGCPAGGVLKWNSGTNWTCQADLNSGGTVTSVTASAPLSVATGTTTPVISLPAATSIQPGYVTTTDWSAFNAKQVRVVGTCAAGSAMTAVAADGTVTCAADANSGGTVTNVSAQGGTPLSVTNGTSTPVINITQASGSANGYLTSTDWNTFNNKQARVSSSCAAGSSIRVIDAAGAVTCQTDTNSLGTVTSVSAATGGGLAVTGTATLTPSVGMRTDCVANQLLKWNGAAWACDVDTTNPGTVTSVTAASAPLSVATGTTTPVISITQATTSASGYLTSTDWNTFNNKQAQVSGTCAGGSSITAVNANGTVTCTPSQSAVFTSGQILALDPSSLTTILTPTVTVSVQTGQRVQWTGSAGFGSTVPGGGVSLQLWPCYKNSVSTWTTIGGNIAGLSVPQGMRSTFTLSATMSPPPGTYQLGLCGFSTVPPSWNYNDYAYISAVVIN